MKIKSRHVETRISTRISIKNSILISVLALLLPVSANASIVAVFGGNSNISVVSFLNANGHTATDYGFGAPTAAQLAGADAVIALRADGNADVQAFVLGGGLLITEWMGAEWALDTANLLNANGGSNSFIGTNTLVTHTAAGLALGLGAGLPNPYADGARTEFQWTLSDIGAGVDILATIPGDIAAIIGGFAGSGYALINSLDWADSFPADGSVSGTWLLNALNLAPQQNHQVPVPVPLALISIGLVGLGLVRRRSAS